MCHFLLPLSPLLFDMFLFLQKAQCFPLQGPGESLLQRKEGIQLNTYYRYGYKQDRYAHNSVAVVYVVYPSEVMLLINMEGHPHLGKPSAVCVYQERLGACVTIRCS